MRVSPALRLLFVLALLFSARAEAFSPMTTATGNELHWVAAEMPIPYFVESVPSSVGAASAIAAIDASFDEWQRPGCTYIEFERVAEAKKTGSRACGGQRNTLEWVETGWPPELGRSVVAITMTCFEPGGGILGARIVFNGQDHQWAADGRSTAIDVRNVTTHEIGHFIGIGHSDVPGTTMWPTTSNGDINQRELHRDDVEAVCYLYPRPQPWSPGNGLGMTGGAKDTVERLGIDRAGGCDADTASGLHGTMILWVLIGLLMISRGRLLGSRRR